MEKLGLCVNLRTLAFTQLAGLSFDSLAVKDGELYALGSDGLYRLDTTKAVVASFATGDLTWSIARNKRLRRVWLYGRTNGNLSLTVTVDQRETRTYAVKPVRAQGMQVGMEVDVGGALQGWSWRFDVSNADGGDFAIDRIEALFHVLSRRV